MSHSKPKAWGTWRNMRKRCLYPNSTQFPYYGGKGITVCDRWNSFDNFYADMGERPEGMTLDRIDPNGNYEPGNCRWASKKEQSQNRTDRKLITAFGKSMLAVDWAEETGLKIETIIYRIKNGWEPERAVSHPPLHPLVRHQGQPSS